MVTMKRAISSKDLKFEDSMPVWHEEIFTQGFGNVQGISLVVG